MSSEEITVVEVVILADDMTGAADTAVAFTSAGLSAAVVVDSAATVSADVVALDLETRDSNEATAAAVSNSGARAAVAMSPHHVYKKVDSTLRGHVAAEVRETAVVCAEATAKTVLCVVAVAFPDVGRVVRNGEVHIQPTSGVAPDMPTSSLSVTSALAWRGQTRMVPLADIRLGVNFVTKVFLQCLDAGTEAVVLDAETSADLRVVAQAGLAVGQVRTDVQVLWVGSGGLARELSGAWGHAVAGPPPSESRLPKRTGRIAAVVGSNTTLAWAQHRTLAAQRGVSGVEVDATLLQGGAVPRTLAVDLLDRALLDGDVSLALARGGQSGKVALRESAALALADLIASTSHPLAALITTGGQTTWAVLRSFGLTGLQVIGEIEPGVVVSDGLGDRSVLVVSKGGSFGDIDTLARCHARLAKAPRCTQHHMRDRNCAGEEDT